MLGTSAAKNSCPANPRTAGIAYHLNSISTLLRNLGYTRQKLQPQSHQQDAMRVAQWKKERLPELKNKQQRKNG